MIADLGRLCRETDPRRKRLLLARLESTLTPKELYELYRSGRGLDAATHAFVRENLVFAEVIGRRRPQGFVAQGDHPDIVLYRDPAGAKRRSLVVALSDGMGHMLLPVSSILQSIPGRDFDVLCLFDRRHAQFLNGIAGHSDSLVEMAHRIARRHRIAGYERIYTFGASMGGFAALRLGILLHARRAISVGGVFPGHVNRLSHPDPGWRPPAFDLLCACGPRLHTELVCWYGKDFRRDREHARRLAAMVPVELRPVAGLDRHNVMHELHKRGELDRFFAEMLDLAGPGLFARLAGWPLRGRRRAGRARAAVPASDSPARRGGLREPDPAPSTGGGAW